MQPGEGDWVTGCRAMFVLGALCAVAGSVCAVLFVLMEFKIISLAVLICAVVAGGTIEIILITYVRVNNYGFIGKRCLNLMRNNKVGL